MGPVVDDDAVADAPDDGDADDNEADDDDEDCEEEDYLATTEGGFWLMMLWLMLLMMMMMMMMRMRVMIVMVMRISRPLGNHRWWVPPCQSKKSMTFNFSRPSSLGYLARKRGIRHEISPPNFIL